MNYNSLINKPTLNHKELIGDNKAADVGGMTEESMQELLATDLTPYYTKAEIDELFARSYVYREKSGSIVTFECPSTAQSIPEVTSGIEATQDLNGYDHPWAGGAEKNKLDPSKKSTSLDNSTFRWYEADGYLLSANQPYTLSCDDSSVRLYFRDKNGGTDLITGYSAITYTPTENITVFLQAYKSSGIATDKFQLELGSSATSYQPYSNICPITGKSAVNVTRTGVNVWDEEWENGYIYDSTGNNMPSNNFIRSKNYIPVKSNETYYFANGGNVANTDVYFYDKNKTYLGLNTSGHITIARSNDTFTIPENAYFMRFYMASSYGSSYNNDISINYPSTDTEYHAYNGTTYTTTLKDGNNQPLTCYGGELTNVNGVQSLTVTHANISSYNGETINEPWISSMDVYATGTTPTTGAQVVYPLTTPEEITQDTLTISSVAGTNNIWTDSGDITVKALDKIIQE